MSAGKTSGNRPGRFIVLGGPGGRIATCSPLGLRAAGSRLRGYVVLFKVNRPITPQLREAALGAVLRCYEVA